MEENPILEKADQLTEPCAMRFCPSVGTAECPLCNRYFCPEHFDAQEHVSGPFKEKRLK